MADRKAPSPATRSGARSSSRPAPYPLRDDAALDDDVQPDSPGLSWPLQQASLGPARLTRSDSSSAHPPASRLSFNDPFAATAAAAAAADSSDSSDDDADGPPLAEEYRLVLERADDTLERLLREGVWSEPTLPTLPSGGAASQDLGASWRLPGMIGAAGDGLLQQLSTVGYPPARATGTRPSSETSEPAQSPPPAQPRGAWQEAPRRSPRTPRAPAAGVAPGMVRTELRLFLGTWNMHGKPPPPALSGEWLPARPAETHDVLVVGTQEAGRTIEKSLLLPSKAKWEAALSAALGEGVAMVASHTLAALHIAVFVRTPLLPLLSHVRTAQVPCGIGNRLGNKGAVAASMCVGGTSLLFVNSHLAAHQKHTSQRNADYRRIEAALPLRPPAAATTAQPPPPAVSAAQRRSASSAVLVGGADDASARFERCFWLGDLNYRVDVSREEADRLLAQPQPADDAPRAVAALLEHDQLRRQMAASEAFGGFTEAAIAFLPTYKFDRHDKALYDLSQKRRVPAWTDRVLSRTRDGGGVVCTRYDSCDSLRSSDHRPVCAEFTVQCAVEAPRLQAVLAASGVPWPLP